MPTGKPRPAPARASAQNGRGTFFPGIRKVEAPVGRSARTLPERADNPTFGSTGARWSRSPWTARSWRETFGATLASTFTPSDITAKMAGERRQSHHIISKPSREALVAHRRLHESTLTPCAQVTPSTPTVGSSRAMSKIISLIPNPQPTSIGEGHSSGVRERPAMIPHAPSAPLATPRRVGERAQARASTARSSSVIGAWNTSSMCG